MSDVSPLPDLQDPQQPQGPRRAPPREAQDRIDRLIKLRADQLQRPRLDDQGKVAIPAVNDPDEALEIAQQALLGFVSVNKDQHQQLRDYIEGKPGAAIPDNWVLDETPVTSQQTMSAIGQAQANVAALDYRRDHPVLSKVQDVASAVHRFYAGAAQVPTNLVVGAANILGAEWTPPNIREMSFPLAPGMSKEQREQAIAALDETASGPGKFAGKVADVGGMIRGIVGGGAPVLVPGGMVGRGVAYPLTKGLAKQGAEKTAEVVGNVAGAAGAFAGYKTVAEAAELGRRPTGEEAIKAAGRGAVEGAALGVASEVARHALRWIFRGPAGKTALTKEDGEILESLQQWAKKNNIRPVEGQTVEGAGNRVIDQWIARGMEGAPAMPVRRLIGQALGGGIEALGFSALDLNFREDLLAAIWSDKPRGERQAAFSRAAETFAANFLGLAASRMRLTDIPGFQRNIRTPGQEPEPSRGTPTEIKLTRPLRQEGDIRLEEDLRTGPQKQIPERSTASERDADQQAEHRMESEGGSQEQGRQASQPDLEVVFWGRSQLGNPVEQRQQSKELPVEGEFRVVSERDVVPTANLRRLGWTPSGGAEVESRRIEMRDTPFSFEVAGEEAIPSRALRERFELPARVPLPDFIEFIERASLLSELQAKQSLPGRLISAAPGIVAMPAGRRPAVMRTIRLGVPMESPLGPEPKWVPAKPFPARGKDAIEPIQQQAVDLLKHVLNNRTDLAQADMALLSKAMGVMDAVSWQNDKAVGEALSMMPDLLVGIANGSPRHASTAIKALAEMLTTKSPEVALDDLRRGQVQTEIGRAEAELSEVKRGLEELETERDKTPEQLAASKAEFVARQEVAEGAVERAKEALRDLDREESVMRRGPSQRQPDRSGEAGFIDIEGLSDAAKRAVETIDKASRHAAEMAVKMPMKALSLALGYTLSPITENPVSQWLTVGLYKKVMRKHPELGMKAFEAIAETRKYQRVFDQIVREFPATLQPELAKPRWSETTEAGRTPGYTEYHVQKETKLKAKFETDASDLSPEARKTVASGDKLMREIRRKANDLGMKISGLRTPESDPVFISKEASKDVLTRQPTPLMVDSLLRRSGKVYEAIVDAFGSENGLEREEVEARFGEMGWIEARGLKRYDPIEMTRSFDYAPDLVRDVDGEVLKLFETNPLRHAKRAAQGAAMRFGVVKVFGQDEPYSKAEVEAARNSPMMPGELPIPYRKIVEKVPPADQEMIATMFRSLMGMPVNKPLHWLEVGSFMWKLDQSFRAMNDVSAAGKMTFGSAVSNISEPFAMASAMFGPQRVLPHYADAWKQFLTGRMTEVLQEREKLGGFVAHVPEWIVGGEHNTLDQFLTAARTAGMALHIPFDFMQSAVDVGVHKTIYEKVAAWRKGESEPGDVDALMTMFDFPKGHAEAVVSGKAPERAYRAIELNGLAALTGRGELAAEKSAFSRSRFGAYIKFTGHFQRQFAKFIKATRDLRENPGQESLRNWGKLLGYNLAAQMIGQSVIKALFGWDEFLGYWRENIDDMQSAEGAGKLFLAAFLGSMVGSFGSTLGGSIYALIQGSDKEKAAVIDALFNAVPGAGAVIETAELGSAMAHNIAGAPIGGESPYAGKTPLQQIGYYLGRNVAAVKWLESGPLGLGLTYIGTDPQLENALKADARINDKMGVPFEGRINPDDSFVDVMRKSVNELKAGDDVGAVASAIRQAFPNKPDDDIAASLRIRRRLSGANWTALTPEQQQQKIGQLGEDRVDLLRGYDAVLDRAASYFDPVARRNRRR